MILIILFCNIFETIAITIAPLQKQHLREVKCSEGVNRFTNSEQSYKIFAVLST